MNRMHVVSFGFSPVILLTGCGVVTLGDPRNATLATMAETEKRIKAYHDTTGSLPPDLSVLPALKGLSNNVNDGWGRPLLYEVSVSDGFKLASEGRDGASGGTGEDEDFAQMYKVVGGNVEIITAAVPNALW